MTKAYNYKIYIHGFGNENHMLWRSMILEQVTYFEAFFEACKIVEDMELIHSIALTKIEIEKL